MAKQKKNNENLFIALVIVAFVGSLSFLSMDKIPITGQQVTVEQPAGQSNFDGYVKDLADVEGVGGAQYCEYKLFKNGAWTGPHFTSKTCSEFSQDNRVLG